MHSSSITKLGTGVPGLDELTYGGLPRSRPTLLIGRSGTCKTVLALQLACTVAKAETVQFVTLEERVSDLEQMGHDLGFDTPALVESKRLRLIEFLPPRERVIIAGEIDLEGLVNDLIHSTERAGATLLVVDSLTALFALYGLADAGRRALFTLASACASREITLIITAESLDDYEHTQGLAAEDYVCDLVLVLRNVVDGKRRRRSIEVQKYRRSPHLKGEYPLVLTSSGVVLFPLDTESGGGPHPQPGDPHQPSRFKSGISGLDEMTGGGWLRDSIALVRGPTGSGKTVLSGIYALTGALRKERVFYYGFEETREALLRNWKTLGIDMQPAIDSGHLKVTSRFPESASTEDMVVELRMVLDEYQPSLIVLDSISAIEHSTSPEMFRQFIVGVISALRHHGRSALLTQAVAPDLGTDIAAPYISTVCDAILVLGYRQRDAELERIIRVLKMRGSNHELGIRRMAIQAGGLVVDSPVDPSP